MCLTPLSFMNCANSSGVNWGPLSDTRCSSRASIVCSEVVEDMAITSGHFE